MAKGKYEYWITPEGLTLIEGWARDGFNALKKGKEVVDFEVENALFKNAINGDTTAQIFWLKNRRPDKWRDKQNIELSKPLDDTAKELEAYFDEKR